MRVQVTLMYLLSESNMYAVPFLLFFFQSIGTRVVLLVSLAR